MFEQRFLTALAIALGTIALTVASAAIIEGDGQPTVDSGQRCGLEPVPEVGVSVLTCVDSYDVERSRVWAVWTHGSHCVAEPGALPGPWRLECDSGVHLSIDSAHDMSWTRCSVDTSDDPRTDVSSVCRVAR